MRLCFFIFWINAKFFESKIIKSQKSNQETKNLGMIVLLFVVFKNFINKLQNEA